MLDMDLALFERRLPGFIRQSNFKDPRQKESCFTYFIDWFSKIIPEGKCARVDPRTDTVRENYRSCFLVWKYQIRAKYAGWNDLDDLHDLDA